MNLVSNILKPNRSGSQYDTRHYRGRRNKRISHRQCKYKSSLLPFETKRVILLKFLSDGTIVISEGCTETLRVRLLAFLDFFYDLNITITAVSSWQRQVTQKFVNHLGLHKIWIKTLAPLVI